LNIISDLSCGVELKIFSVGRWLVLLFPLKNPCKSLQSAESVFYLLKINKNALLMERVSFEAGTHSAGFE